ncbi:homeodomain-like transcriptional regulator [Actinidia rufa]|uniref:Homeodomain-like transcriptional regulator n=1 Tax=Actinidia rufa TaxID=165716 RepID=A0A7J0GUR5_9ERIC|nr:homeodomain-like transcriptional regulator [Actinidia rufa]
MTGREKRGVGNSKGRKKDLRTHRLRLHECFLEYGLYTEEGVPQGWSSTRCGVRFSIFTSFSSLQKRYAPREMRFAVFVHVLMIAAIMRLRILSMFGGLVRNSIHLRRRGSKNSHRACHENQRALQGNKGSRNCDLACNENQRSIKRRKVSEPTLSDYQVSNKKSALVKQHGIGKGLMTVWRAINPDGGDFPTGVNFKERESTTIFQMSTFASQKPFVQEKKKSRKRQPVAVGHLICLPKL